MGKNFSMNNCGKRQPRDFYETPYSLTWQLIETNELKDCNTFLEPACGNLAIVKVFQKYSAASSTFRFNLKKLDYYDLTYFNRNFLHETGRYECIVTNPPYSIFLKFVLHAKMIATKKIVMLLPLSYLHGQHRYEKLWLDKEFPLKVVYVFTRYPLLGEKLRDDGKYHTGMQVYAWYIWEKGYTGEPIIRHIDNNRFVLPNDRNKISTENGELFQYEIFSVQ